MTPIRHLYVHIPFCPKVCPYCSFYKEASDRNKTQRFLDALLAELERESTLRPLQPHTIFFGGGTPSALSTPQLDYLLSGMQSWDPELLKVLGRVHTAGQAERSYEILREAGFENVNLDLIFAVPTQTRGQWRASLEKTIALGPEHISAYCLTYEEDTAFYRKFQNGEFTQDNDWDADLFETTIDLLGAAGYGQYEISNYAKAGRECLHNLGYWLGSDYLGLGPSAFSTRGARRWQNIPNTEEYSTRVLGGASAMSFEETLDAPTRRGEAIAFGLRTSHGVPLDLLEPWQGTVDEYLSEGFFSSDGSRIRLTRKGKMVADTLAETFVGG